MPPAVRQRAAAEKLLELGQAQTERPGERIETHIGKIRLIRAVDASLKPGDVTQIGHCSDDHIARRVASDPVAKTCRYVTASGVAAQSGRDGRSIVVFDDHHGLDTRLIEVTFDPVEVPRIDVTVLIDVESRLVLVLRKFEAPGGK